MRTVDALGTWCPVPIHLIDRAARAGSGGDELLLLADDPLIEVDLPAWCHRTGHLLLCLSEVRGEFRCRVRLVGLDRPDPGRE